MWRLISSPRLFGLSEHPDTGFRADRSGVSVWLPSFTRALFGEKISLKGVKKQNGQNLESMIILTIRPIKDKVRQEIFSRAFQKVIA